MSPMKVIVFLANLPLWLQLPWQIGDIDRLLATYKPPYRQTPPSENRPSTADNYHHQNIYAEAFLKNVSYTIPSIRT